MSLRISTTLVLCLAATACGRASEDFSSAMAAKSGSYPTHPDEQMTPGATCQRADELRYPERIKYCTRNVASSLKKQIIQDYDKSFGYTIGSMNRQDFKIDHYIPLCMGGANTVDNLWPQHKSVYNVTDPLEAELCQVMASGKMKQVDAIATIKRAKFNLESVDQIRASLRDL